MKFFEDQNPSNPFCEIHQQGIPCALHQDAGQVLQKKDSTLQDIKTSCYFKFCHYPQSASNFDQFHHLCLIHLISIEKNLFYRL